MSSAAEKVTDLVVEEAGFVNANFRTELFSQHFRGGKDVRLFKKLNEHFGVEIQYDRRRWGFTIGDIIDGYARRYTRIKRLEGKSPSSESDPVYFL